MAGIIYGITSTGEMLPVQINSNGQLVVSGGSGGGGGGTSDTTEATQLLVKTAVQAINTKTPALVGGAIPVTGLLTDTQLRASPVSVLAANRQCVGRQSISLAANTVTTLTVPAGAYSALIQADGNTVRITLDGTTAPTSTVGLRLDDGVFFSIDSALANVKMLAPTACSVQVCYFDKA